MLGIVWQIIQILGIILLIILALIVVLILCALFVPVRYKVKASAHPVVELPKRDNMSEAVLQNQFQVNVTVSWLLHIFSVCFQLNKEGVNDPAVKPTFDFEQIKQKMYCKVRILGIPLVDFLHQKPKKAEKSKNKIQTKKASRDKASGKRTAKEKQEQNSLANDLDTSEEIQQDKIKQENTQQEDVPHEDELTNPNSKLKYFIDAIKKLFEKLFEKLMHIKYTIIEFKEKLINAKNKIEYYKEVLTKDETRPARDKAFKQLKNIWHNIKPTKCKLVLTLGLNDPALMGNVMAILGICIPVLGDTIMITPLFDCCQFEEDFEMKGHLTLYVFLKMVWIVLFDKDIKEFRDLLMNPKG